MVKFMNLKIQYKTLVCKDWLFVQCRIKINSNSKKQNVHKIESFFDTFVVLFQQNGQSISNSCISFQK